MIDLVQPTKFEESEEWEVKSLEKICNILDNKRVPLNKEERAEKKPGEIPYYGATGVMDYIDDYLFDGEYILIAEDGGPFEEHTEKAIAQKVSGKFWVNNHAHIIEVDDSVDDVIQDYLFYAIEHADVSRIVQGKGRQKLTQSQLRKLRVPVPPVEEQERIVSLLSDVDEYIEKTSERVHALEQSKQAVLQRVFAVKGDDINTINPQYRWESQPMGEICSVTSGSSFPQDYQDDSTQGIPVIKVGDLQEELYIDSAEFSVTQKEIDELGHTVYDEGTIILPKNGESIRTAKVNILNSECAVDNNVMVISVEANSVTSEWVAYFLDYYDLIRIAPGTTAPTISNKTMNALEIPVPPKSEQDNIISTLSQIDKALGQTNEDLESMRELKQGLLQDIFSE